MPEQLNNALYVYGITKENEHNWICLGLERNQVFIIPAGELNVLVHKCEAKPYAPKDPKKIKELVVKHNDVLEQAIKSFGSVLPFSFNTIVQEKDGKTAEENLKGWVKKEEEKFIQLFEKVNLRKEYGIKFFYDRKKWIEEIGAQSIPLSGKSEGINYLLKGKQETEIKDKLIKKINGKRQEIFNAIKLKVQEIEIAQPKIKLMEEERDLLMGLSILANKQEFNEVKQYLLENRNQRDYRFAGPFPPYSFVIIDGINAGENG